MPRSPFRLVLDTNVLLRGIGNLRSPSGQIVSACERRGAVIVLSKSLMSEYRTVMSQAEVIERIPRLTPENVELSMRRLKYLGDVIDPIALSFTFPRDPADEKLIEVAIAGRASHLITVDHDLLDLRSGHDDAARRLRQQAPALIILDPSEFIRRHGAEIGSAHGEDLGLAN